MKKINKIFDIFSFDLRSLALFRIFLGVMILLDLIYRLPDFRAFYTDSGVLPNGLLFQLSYTPWRLSLYFINGTEIFSAMLFVTTAALAILLIVGWNTRLVTVFSWILFMSLHNRNPYVLDAGDRLFRYFFFWAMFLPLGAHFSFDERSSKDFSQKGGNDLKVFSAGTVAYTLQVVMMYWFAIAIKLNHIEWLNGKAVSLALSLPDVRSPLGVWLLQFPKAMEMLSHITMAIETLAPLLLLMVPAGLVRSVTVFMMMMMHVGFAACMNLGLFPLVDILCLVPFMPAWFWEKLKTLYITQEKTIELGISSLKRFLVVPTKALMRFPQKELWKGELPRWASFTVYFLVGYVFLWNLTTSNLPYVKFQMPNQWRALGYITTLDQMWGMFAPAGNYKGIWVMSAQDFQDNEFNLLNGSAPVRWEIPLYVKYPYLSGGRWSLYLGNLQHNYVSLQANHFGSYLCRRSSEDNKPLKKIDMYYVYEYFYPQKSPTQKVLLHSSTC